ncbi:sensor domain-containing protein [Salinarchaeum sp. IM2453]|uniref:sensor domain-containing protein n=1 Tax=Salinarchaeum sp. IM2453 TaxID=2862870 RepID=UPI00210721F0|nr:sensor domain-containing protein [Salinarchaeum sp. IM2453]
MSTIQLNSLYSIFTEFISVVTERQTYRNLLYLLITSIVGGIYFLGIFFGFTVSAILVFALIGIPLFAVLIIGARGAAAFEQRLTNRLLETEIQSPDSEIDPRTEGLRPAFRELS